MLKFRILSVFIITLLFSVFALAYPKEAILLFSEFKKAETQIEQRHISATNNLPSKYIEGLVALQKHYQSEGALDELLAVKKELERFQKASLGPFDPFELVPELPKDAIVASPDALRLGQERYIAKKEQIENAVLTDFENLSQGLLKRLEAIQRDLTKSDQIDDAIKVRQLILESREAISNGSISEFASKIALKSPSASSAKAEKKGASSFSKWVSLGDMPFSPSLRGFCHSDLQSTVSVSPHSIGTGFDFFATSGPSPQTVASTLCREVGQTLCWRVNSLEDLAIDIKATSHKLSTGRNKGPLLCVAVFSGKNQVATIRVPLMQKDMCVRILQDPSVSTRFAIFCRGGAPRQFELRDGIPINVMVGVALVGVRETCDTLIDFE